jgi:hypothetical protein
VKKLLIILGAIFLVLLVFGGVALIISIVRGTALDKESSAYADAALRDIVSQWSEKALLDRASPEFKQAVTIDQLDGDFRFCGLLGALQHADPMRGGATIFWDNKRGKIITGNYTTKAQFENADATITLRLIKHGDQWQILKFDVQAPGFHPRPTPNQTMQPTASWCTVSVSVTRTRSLRSNLAAISGGLSLSR